MNLKEKLALNKPSSKVQDEIYFQSHEMRESILLLIKENNPGNLFYPLHFIDQLIKELISWRTCEFYKHYNWNHELTKEVGEHLNEESKIYNKIVMSSFKAIKERNFKAEFELNMEERKKYVTIIDKKRKEIVNLIIKNPELNENIIEKLRKGNFGAFSPEDVSAIGNGVYKNGEAYLRKIAIENDIELCIWDGRCAWDFFGKSDQEGDEG